MNRFHGRGVPDGCSTIPICIEPDHPVHDISDFILQNDDVIDGIPPCFTKSLNAETVAMVFLGFAVINE